MDSYRLGKCYGQRANDLKKRMASSRDLKTVVREVVLITLALVWVLLTDSSIMLISSGILVNSTENVFFLGSLKNSIVLMAYSMYFV